MDYREIMDVFSQIGLGSLLISEDDRILEVNDVGNQLLRGEGDLIGKDLNQVAAPLCERTESHVYARTAFGEYVLRCTSPKTVEIPTGTRMIVFRRATNDAYHEMLISVLNQLNEAVTICDEESRICVMNDSAIRMESLMIEDVIGVAVDHIYQMRDGADLSIPEVIRTKQPRLNWRQHYTTCYGKKIDMVSNNYPIIRDGRVLGGFSIMQDWSTVDKLNRQIIELQEKVRKLESPEHKEKGSMLRARYRLEDIVYLSQSMSSVLEQCHMISESNSSVMIYGETGTGKEMIAQGIHNASNRANGPFLAINCAAIPENLLESMLFGTEKGAFTGATSSPGLFEQADKGTLLLDEINAMNINIQAKLLRVLQEKSVRRVGGLKEKRVDVRVLSNINMPPYQAIAENKLRSDLFYRLGVVNINIPPLRERTEDIPLLVKNFVMRYNKELLRNVGEVAPETLDILCRYAWPGNVRELQHAIEHAMNLIPKNTSIITAKYLPAHILASIQTPAEHVEEKNAGRGIPLETTIKRIEREAICRALRENSGNVSAAARDLEMSRHNLEYRIKRYKIEPNEFV